jgi:hypothetical protein
MKNIMDQIIDQLKVKPIPKSKQSTKLMLPDKSNEDDLIEVDLNFLLQPNKDFHIYDRSKEENEFNESEFMKEINEVRNVRQNIPKIDNEESKILGQNIVFEDAKKVNSKVKQKRKKIHVDTTKPAITEIYSYNIGDEIKLRLPQKKDIVLLKKPSYYMNNREYFLKSINSLFSEYRSEIMNTGIKVECDKVSKNVITKNKDGSKVDTKDFSLLTHQKIVLDYLNIYTPYRGLLLYHGLGSGKTCSSIAVSESFLTAASSIAFAEGLMQSKKVIVMTPASLRVNYFEELKKCGNPIYKKKQFWEFIPLTETDTKDMLSNVLQLPEKYIESKKGAWMVNVNKSSNYDTLSPIQKSELDKQLNEMIHYKYQFINYNGLQKKHVNKLTENNTINPFDNKVVIIDEAHNFISRIVNKLGKSKNTTKDITKFTSTILYHNLMKASNAKIIFLSGTPIINYPNEIAILYNILRGYIRTVKIPIVTGQKKYTQDQFNKMFAKNNIVDYMEYKQGVLSISRTPFGFVNKFYGLSYKGVRYNNKDELTDNKFIENVLDILKTQNILANTEQIKIINDKALPDKLEEFQELFLDSSNGNMKNTNLFKKRILGLTSYFKSAQEGLMPEYEPLRDTHIISIDMSDYQFVKYQEARLLERTNESKSRKAIQFQKHIDNLYQETKSTYRIFSRAFCNFVFPDPPGRPMPGETLEDSIKITDDEDNIDALSFDERLNSSDGRFTEEDIEESESNYDNESYALRVKNAIEILNKNSSKYLVGDNLSMFSPKFSYILNNIDTMEGLHLLYSQFRTIEGIGVFSMVLEANGYTRLRIKKNNSQQWVLNTSIENIKEGKSFALYTGTESAEEKEIIRHIFNGTWEYLPLTLTEQLNQISPNNINGEIIKLFMITASGAEGISLMNTRYIHIMEPYWHPVRTEQVIGRARRICSHVDLPKEKRNIKVFYYLMKFTDEQIEKKMNNDIRNNDVSKLDKINLRPQTSDEALYETSKRKENISNQILKNIKEAAIDCAVHSTSSSEESLECYSFGNDVDPKLFSYRPNISDDDKDGNHQKLNEAAENWRAKVVKINGINYARRLNENNQETDKVYDLDQYMQAMKNPQVKITLIGKIIEKDGKKFIDTNV